MRNSKTLAYADKSLDYNDIKTTDQNLFMINTNSENFIIQSWQDL